MRYSTIQLECSGPVATITLDRPDRMNAFNRSMAAELVDVWARLGDDDAIRAMVLRGAPGRAFCTGVDVKDGWRTPREAERPFEKQDPGQALSPKRQGLFKPLIVAVHGLCAGGAFYFLNDADIVICADDAEFFDPHVTYGQVAAVEPVGALARVPLPEILRMALMGAHERVGAATALRISLVTEVVAAADLHARADAIAKTIASQPPVAVQGTIRAIWDALSMPRDAAVLNALKYTQLGNPLGTRDIDRADVKPQSWRTR